MPWSPVTILSATKSFTIVAPIGYPFPRAFAVVRMSGCGASFDDEEGDGDEEDVGEVEVEE